MTEERIHQIFQSYFHAFTDAAVQILREPPHSEHREMLRDVMLINLERACGAYAVTWELDELSKAVKQEIRSRYIDHMQDVFRRLGQ